MGQLTVLLVQGVKKKRTHLESLSVFTAGLESLEYNGHQYYLHTMLLVQVQVFYLFLLLTEVMFTESGQKEKKRKLLFPLALTSNTDIFSTTFAFYLESK